jgi:hypothetical protein
MSLVLVVGMGRGLRGGGLCWDKNYDRDNVVRLKMIPPGKATLLYDTILYLFSRRETSDSDLHRIPRLFSPAIPFPETYTPPPAEIPE